MTIKRPGKRSSKLSDHSYTGRFLEFVDTDKNVRYYDTNTKKIKVATHVTFDEAYFTIKDNPPGAVALQNVGLSQESIQ